MPWEKRTSQPTRWAQTIGVAALAALALVGLWNLFASSPKDSTISQMSPSAGAPRLNATVAVPTPMATLADPSSPCDHPFAYADCRPGAPTVFAGSIGLKGGTRFTTTLSPGSPTASTTITLPDTETTLVGRNTVDVLTNKSFSGATDFAAATLTGDVTFADGNGLRNVDSILIGTSEPIPEALRINSVSPVADSYNANAGFFVKDYDGNTPRNHNTVTIWQSNRPDIKGKNNPGGCIGFGGAEDDREPNSIDTKAGICYWEDGGLGRLIFVSSSTGATIDPTGADRSFGLVGNRLEIHALVDTNYNLVTLGGNAPAEGRAGIILPDDNALAGLFPNQAGLYADDVAGTVEVFAIDEAGNTTQLSAHPSTLLDRIPPEDCEYPWAYHSSKEYLGKEVYVDWCGAITALEELTGQQFIFVTDIPKQDWYEPKLRACDKAFESLPQSERDEFVCDVDDPPWWLQERGVEVRSDVAWSP